MAQAYDNESSFNMLVDDSAMSLTSDQQESLIEHWDDPVSLYKHIKDKFIDITNLCRRNKLRQQLSEYVHSDEDLKESVDMKEDLIKKRKEIELSQKSEWNYLIICLQQLLKLNNQNISYHLLAIQIYQAHPVAYNENTPNSMETNVRYSWMTQEIAYSSASPNTLSVTSSPSSIDNDRRLRSRLYLDLAVESCNSGISLSLIHLNGHHASFYIWITTFYVLKAQILFQQRKWQRVIDSILPSLRYQQSENIHLLYNLRASAYCELKQFHEAIADYGIAISKSSEPSSYYNSRGTCYHELGQFDKALIDYNAAIECNKKCVSAYNNRASLYVDMKKYKLALEDANRGLIIYENHGNLYKHRGLAHFYLRNYDQCLLDLQKSIKFAPKYRPARITLKMLWDFYYKHLIKITLEIDDNIHMDLCIILVDYIVGDNYQVDDNMVDATYADWKKEMAQQDEERRIRQQQQEAEQEQEQEEQEEQEDEEKQEQEQEQEEEETKDGTGGDDNDNDEKDEDKLIEADLLFLACGCKKALDSFWTDASEEEKRIFGGIEPHTLCATLFEYDAQPELETHQTVVDIWPNICWKGSGQIYAYRNSAKCLMGHDKYDELIKSGKLKRDRGVSYQFFNRPPNVEEDSPALLHQLQNDLEVWGEKNIKILRQETWDYMPMWNGQDVQKQYPWIVKDELQGKYKKTFYIGSSVCFESVLNVVEYNYDICNQYCFDDPGQVFFCKKRIGSDKGPFAES